MEINVGNVHEFYVLHVDGVGEYAMRHEDGGRCLFLFTSQSTITKFVEMMEMPTHRSFSAIPISASELKKFLIEVKSQNTQAIAFDPIANCEFTPFDINELIEGQI